MKRHWQYLKYILRHKWYVFCAARSLGITWLGIVHDLSKFKPGEWRPYANTFYNKDGSKRYQEHPEFTEAWLHHQNRNKHHWQYWMITWDRGETECLPMPDRYRREMLADWIGAGKALGKPDTAQWYEANERNMQLHPDTRAWIEDRIIEIAISYIPISQDALSGWGWRLNQLPLKGFGLRLHETVVAHIEKGLEQRERDERVRRSLGV